MKSLKLKLKDGNHERTCKCRPDYEEQIEKRRKGARITSQNNIGKFLSPRITLTLNCKHCGKPYVITITKHKFEINDYTKYCSRSCANTRIISEETKNKISQTIQDKYPPKQKIKCKDCGKLIEENKTGYCCDCVRHHISEFWTDETKEKIRQGGLKSSKLQSDIRRSKNEMAFCELCEKHFKNVKHNEQLFNGWDADVIIEDIKVAVLWNGPWHYRKLFKSHKLKQIQNRDKIKVKEIENFGYTPYIIKDDGNFNTEKVQTEFKIFLEKFT